MNEEDFLKRWSRRKREADEVARPEQAVAGEPAPDEAAAQKNESEAEFDLASLPPLESITSISDVTAFLRAGVPADLARAALRRVWTVDPAIRDFVGLAENAWDFTDPNAMPGFGPLEATDDVRRMVASIMENIGDKAKALAEGAGETLDASGDSNDSSQIGASHPGDPAPSGKPGTDLALKGPAQNLGNEVLLHSNNNDDAVQNNLTEVSDKPARIVRRTHGSALPE